MQNMTQERKYEFENLPDIAPSSYMSPQDLIIEQAKMESRRMIKVHPHPRNSDTNNSSMFEEAITGFGSMIPRNPSVHKFNHVADSKLNKDL